jgi:perosamine synthetase
MDQEEIDAVADVLKSGWIGLGPKTEEFENNFSDYIGVDDAVGVNSATAALDLALKLLRINHGDEVIVPTMTFVSTAHVVAYNLATPIFADIDPVTLSIDIDDVEKKITKRTKAIIPVHYSGRPVDMDRLKEVAGEIPIIEDAAHACGAEYKGRKCGSLGDIGCFSFHAVKNLSMGDGGALTLNDKAMAGRAKRLRWLGIDKGTWDRSEINKTYWWEYFVDEIGLKCHMNDIMAAIGLVQLSKLDRMNTIRKEIAKEYTDHFNAFDWIVTPPLDNQNFKSASHLYYILVENRDDLSTYLKDKGISTGVHYKPIHLYPCYGNRTHLPVAEDIFPRLLSLPIFPGMKEKDLSMIIDAIISFGEKKQ